MMTRYKAYDYNGDGFVSLKEFMKAQKMKG